MKDERFYLGHIRSAISDIRTYASVGEESFLADRMRQDAIIRKLEIIGEAVKRLSEATRAQRPEIPLEADRRHAGSVDARLLRRRPRSSVARCRAGSPTS